MAILYYSVYITIKENELENFFNITEKMKNQLYMKITESCEVLGFIKGFIPTIYTDELENIEEIDNYETDNLL